MKAHEQDSIEKLKKKAELNRHAHSCLADRARCWRRAFEIVVAALTLGLSVMIVLLYREIFPGAEDTLLFGIALIPPLVLFVQALGSVLNWTEREAEHSLAIHIWGIWIRDADDPDKSPVLRERYQECMEKTPSIPNRKFLFYKIGLKRKIALAKMIDDLDEGSGDFLDQLDEIKKVCIWYKR